MWNDQTDVSANAEHNFSCLSIWKWSWGLNGGGQTLKPHLIIHREDYCHWGLNKEVTLLYTVQFRSLDFWDTKYFSHWTKNSMPFLLHWIQTDSCWLKTSLVSKFMFIICDDVMDLSYVSLVCLIHRVVFCSLLADCMQCLLHYCGYGRRTYIICRCRVCVYSQYVAQLPIAAWLYWQPTSLSVNLCLSVVLGCLSLLVFLFVCTVQYVAFYICMFVCFLLLSLEHGSKCFMPCVFHDIWILILFTFVSCSVRAEV